MVSLESRACVCVCLLKVVYLICSIVIFQFKAYLYYLLGDFSIDETLLNVQSKQQITSQISQDLFLASFFSQFFLLLLFPSLPGHLPAACFQ